MNFIPATKARKNFFKLLDEANKPGGVVTITLSGEAKVVMISAEEFESWQETLEITDDKELMRGIDEAMNEKGKLYSHEEIKKKLKL